MSQLRTGIGTKQFLPILRNDFTQTKKQTDYETAPPRPYLWKTDEFDIYEAKH